VLFGGGTPNGKVLGDTWLWTGKTWEKASPKVSPPGTAEPAMAYDGATSQLLMFGGETADGLSTAATWEWTGTTWEQLSPKTSPPALIGVSAAYDATSKQLLVIGGSLAALGKPQTWEWSGSTWIQLQPKTSPPAPIGASIAYDVSTGGIVLFGGYELTENASVAAQVSSQTWTWLGKNWTQEKPAKSPPARFAAAMAFDAATHQLVLFGGAENSSTSQALSDTWSWSGSAWTELSPSDHPSARAVSSVVYDVATMQLILFGGSSDTGTALGDTWLWALTSK
jgi:hypothetical protein